jgi:hypothetical protein
MPNSAGSLVFLTAQQIDGTRQGILRIIRRSKYRQKRKFWVTEPIQSYTNKLFISIATHPILFSQLIYWTQQSPSFSKIMSSWR